MTPDEARTLQLHERVQWQDDPDDDGEVIYVTKSSVSIRWSKDGKIGVYRFNRLTWNYINRKHAQKAS